MWLDRSGLSNRRNLSSEILTLQKILSQGIQMKYKYRSWRLDGVGKQGAM